MASRTRATTSHLPRTDLADARSAVKQAASAEADLTAKLTRHDEDLQRVRGAIAKNAETANRLNEGASVTTNPKSGAATKAAHPSTPTARKSSVSRTAAKKSPAKSTAKASAAKSGAKASHVNKKSPATKSATPNPTKKQISRAQATLSDVRVQEKKLTKKLDRHAANLRDLKHDILASEKDVAKVETKLVKSKQSRQRAQKKLKSLQS